LIENAVLGGYFMLMHTVELNILKDKLDEYVRLAAAGETVVITDHSRAVAEIVPPRSKPESIIERGVREGWITPASNPGGAPPSPKPVPGLTFEQLMEDLARDREDRW
jgi:antitoxin (DNA-binding transcriptional repressor) of toxin-antitoxin stability system